MKFFWKVDVMIWQVDINIWRVNIKIWQVNIVIWRNINQVSIEYINLIFVKFFQPVVCNDQIQVPNSTGDIDPCGT